MSRRNSLEEKAKRRRLKLLRATPPAFIDLEEYVRIRARCSRSTARKVLLSGALKVESHPVGYKLTKDGRKVYDPFLPAKFRDQIEIVAPEFLTKETA